MRVKSKASSLAASKCRFSLVAVDESGVIGFVVPPARGQGIGRALVAAAEAWGRAQGCTEFASDALLDNGVSAAAHAALGFEEVVQIRCFRRDL